MKFRTVHSLAQHSLLAAQDICDHLRCLISSAPSLLLLYFTQAHDGAILREALKRQFPTTRLLGCRSCGGVMTEMGDHASPGQEEGLLAGIEAELGASVPVGGGSAADNSVCGHWQLGWDQGVSQNGIVLAVLYPDCQLAFQFHLDYVPAEFSGEITACEGREVRGCANALSRVRIVLARSRLSPPLPSGSRGGWPMVSWLTAT